MGTWFASSIFSVVNLVSNGIQGSFLYHTHSFTGWPSSRAGLALLLAYGAFWARTPHWVAPVVWYNFTPAGHKILCSVTGLALACLLILDCRNRDRGTAWASRQMPSLSLWPFQTSSPEDRFSNMISFQRASLLPFLWLLRRRRWRS